MRVLPYRAAARIGWRQAWRARWRSALVVATVALPIAGLSLAAVVIHTGFPTPRERLTAAMGAADIALDYSRRLDSAALARDLPDGSNVVMRRFLSASATAGGSRLHLKLTEFSVPLDRSPVRGMLALMSGREPTRPGEVALAPHVLTDAGVAIGDELTLGKIKSHAPRDRDCRQP